MTQEDKELLLKDISARLPYGVKVRKVIGDWTSDPHPIRSINLNNIIVEDGEFEDGTPDIDVWDYEDIKPYLFPLSSMTEEQFVELKVFADLTDEGNTLELVEWNDNYKTLEFWLEEIPSYCVIKVFDWLNKNHFDYRGLIEEGLAIDATRLNIY